MNYYVYINGETHKLTQGFTVNEEYNETLDSASIIISNSKQLNLEPYDDVFIYGEWCGVYDVESKKIIPNYSKKFNFKGYPVSNGLYKYDEMPCFYKHFLLYKFSETIIYLGENENDTRYQYTIDLFSETKGLETIQAPNISITLPLSGKKRGVVEYTKRFLELYNKNIKIGTSSSWKIKQKYSIGDTDKIKYLGTDGQSYTVSGILSNVETVFNDSYPPEMSMNSPSLRQILEKIFIIKDCIPVVHDGEIYAMDITLRRGEFNLKKGQINYITGSKSSENFCTDLRRTYNDALSQESSTRYVEYLGFRNSDVGLMTFENMRLETKFPIYKINKIYMCYYKKMIVSYPEKDDEGEETGAYIQKQYCFLCKQDITPLVKLNSERNLLLEDPDKAKALSRDSTIDEVAKHKFATVGYDIGSKYITGWGNKFTYYDNNFFSFMLSQNGNVISYLENIFNYLDNKYPFGIDNQESIIKDILGDELKEYTIAFHNGYGSIIIPNNSQFDKKTDGSFCNTVKNVLNIFSDSDSSGDTPTNIDKWLDSTNRSLVFKHLVFKIDYQGLFSGSIITSKGLGKDNITINDNQSSSLSLLEIDGLAQKEKINRYGNKGIQINARYKEINDVQELGTTYNHNNDQDIVIYHKEFSVCDNVINCSYYGSKDYVLKDYYTSVFARYRTYKLMSYSESITRAENKKIYLLISKDKLLVDENLEANINDTINLYENLFSFYKQTEIKNDSIAENDKIWNYGYYCVEYNNQNIYIVSDVIFFVSGNSLCCNISMDDNVTGGIYVDKIKNYSLKYNTSKCYTGSLQKYIYLTDAAKNGEIDTMTFTFSHVNNASLKNNFEISSDDEIAKTYNYLYNLPNITNFTDNINETNKISFSKKIYKDNKEKINMTLQFEPIEDNVYVSQYFFKLSNLFFNKNKFYKDVSIPKTATSTISSTPFCRLLTNSVGNNNVPWPVIAIAMKKTTLNGHTSIEGFDSSPGVLINCNFEIIGPSDAKSQKLSIYLKKWTETNYYYESEKQVDRYAGKMKAMFDFQVYNETLKVYTYYQTTKILGFNNHTTDCDLYGNEWYLGQKKYDVLKSEFEAYCKNQNANFKIDDYVVLMCSLVEHDLVPELTIGNTTFGWQKITGSTNSNYYNFSSTSNFICYKNIKISENLKQNLYWFTTPDNYVFKDYMVQDELNNDKIIQKKFTECEYGGDNLKIEFAPENPQKVTVIHKETGGYVLCYYKDDSELYHFVFGFKPNDVSEKKTNIYLSLIQFKDLTIFNPDSNLPSGEVKNSINSKKKNILFLGFDNIVLTTNNGKKYFGSSFTINNFEDSVLEYTMKPKQGFYWDAKVSDESIKTGSVKFGSVDIITAETVYERTNVYLTLRNCAAIVDGINYSKSTIIKGYVGQKMNYSIVPNEDCYWDYKTFSDQSSKSGTITLQSNANNINYYVPYKLDKNFEIKDLTYSSDGIINFDLVNTGSLNKEWNVQIFCYLKETGWTKNLLNNDYSITFTDDFVNFVFSTNTTSYTKIRIILWNSKNDIYGCCEEEIVVTTTLALQITNCTVKLYYASTSEAIGTYDKDTTITVKNGSCIIYIAESINSYYYWDEILSNYGIVSGAFDVDKPTEKTFSPSYYLNNTYNAEIKYLRRDSASGEVQFNLIYNQANPGTENVTFKIYGLKNREWIETTDWFTDAGWKFQSFTEEQKIHSYGLNLDYSGIIILARKGNDYIARMQEIFN